MLTPREPSIKISRTLESIIVYSRTIQLFSHSILSPCSHIGKVAQPLIFRLAFTVKWIQAIYLKAVVCNLPYLPSSSLASSWPGSAEVICGSSNILPQHETWSPSKRVFAATYSLSALQRSLGLLHYPSLVKVPIQPPPRFPGTGIMSDLSWSLQNGIFRFLPLKSTPDFSCEISRSPSRHSSYFGSHLAGYKLAARHSG